MTDLCPCEGTHHVLGGVITLEQLEHPHPRPAPALVLCRLMERLGHTSNRRDNSENIAIVKLHRMTDALILKVASFISELSTVSNVLIECIFIFFCHLAASWSCILTRRKCHLVNLW